MVKNLISHWGRTLRLAAVEQESDAQLLGRFAAVRDEVAFETLVKRHGTMVWGVCHRLLFHHQDAEDAFQTTFLVLAKRADAIGRPGRLANWLFGVARRTSLNLRRRRERLARSEGAAIEIGALPDRSLARDEQVRAILDEELARLPARYRLPIVLCCLEGQTHVEAGRHLSWPTGTVAGRLFRGRELLRSRLQRRGIEISAVVLATTLVSEACASLPGPLMIATTARNAKAFVGASGAAGLISNTVRQLAGVTLSQSEPARGVFWLAGLAGLGLCLGGLGLTYLFAGSPRADVPPASPAPGKTTIDAADHPRADDRFVPLPADPSIAVVTMEVLDDKNHAVRNHLTIRADGTLIAEGDSGGAAMVSEGRLAPEELQTLVQFIVHDQQFLDFQAAAVDRELRRDFLYDARITGPGDVLTTRIKLRTASTEHEVTWSRLGTSTMLFREAERMRQLAAIDRRLRNVLLVQQAGGAARVQEMADWAMQRLRPTYPRLAPLTSADLCEYRLIAEPPGTRISFAQGIKYDPTTGYFAVMFDVPKRGPPQLVQVTPRASDEAPIASRRMCGGPDDDSDWPPD